MLMYHLYVSILNTKGFSFDCQFDSYKTYIKITDSRKNIFLKRPHVT